MKMFAYFIRTILVLMLASTMWVEASITTNYGNHEATAVFYNQVSEANTVTNNNGMYRAPIISGNAMTFNPLDMKAESSGGGYQQNDYQLAFEIQAKTNNAIQRLDFVEAGDFSMGGTGGTDGTGVDVNATFLVTIHEVDGVDLLTPIQKTFGPVTDSMIFSPNADGTFQLVTDGGSTGFPPYADAWDGSLNIDLLAILDSEGISYNTSGGVTGGVTHVTMNIDNVLAAISESGTSSYIQKKQFGGFSVTSVIPEPASALLLVGTASLFTFIRRRFIG